MNGEFIIIAMILAAAMLILLIAKLVSFFRRFFEAASSICYQMDHAGSYKEYRSCWEKLRCHYLTLIPFVNEKNVMRVYRRIFRKGERAEKQERKDSLVPLLLPSILGISVCLVCICSMTWAWYSASVETSAQKMTAAYYEITVESVVSETDVAVQPIDGAYTLNAGTVYTVTLKADGSVKDCGGYCLIQRVGADAKFYTQSLKPGDRLEFRFTADETDAYTFTGVWGSQPAGVNEEDVLKGVLSREEATAEPSGSDPNAEPTVSEPAADPTFPADDQTSEPFDGTYTVQRGDSLVTIARKYNTTAAKLAAYNNISDPDRIQAGQVLQIPPEDYVIPTPEATVPKETSSSETKAPSTEPPAAEPTEIPVTEPAIEP